MRRLAIALAAVAAALAASAVPARAQTSTTASDSATAPGRRVVQVVEIAGLFDRVLADFVVTSVANAAEDPEVIAVVIQLDSSTAVVSADRVADVAAAVQAAGVPVGIWVGPSGSRAGADLRRILAAADVVGVSPGSKIVGEADNEAPTLGDFIVGLDETTLDGVVLDTADVVTTPDGPRREPNINVRFTKLGLTARLVHTVASPSVAYLLLCAGLVLLLFELFTGGIGVAGVTGAVCLGLAGLGLAALPIAPWALGLFVVAAFGFGVDIQTGVPRVWTAIAIAALVAGSALLFTGPSPSLLAWVTGLAATIGMAVSATPAVARSRYGTPTIGRDWMLGELGEVVEAVDPEGVVLVRGARWRARANRATPVAVGAGARVVGIAGVVLEVEPETGGARDYRERARHRDG